MKRAFSCVIWTDWVSVDITDCDICISLVHWKRSIIIVAECQCLSSLKIISFKTVSPKMKNFRFQHKNMCGQTSLFKMLSGSSHTKRVKTTALNQCFSSGVGQPAHPLLSLLYSPLHLFLFLYPRVLRRERKYFGTLSHD